MALSLEDWVETQYKERYCNKQGKLICPINWHKFTNLLIKMNPTEGEPIRQITRRMHLSTAPEPVAAVPGAVPDLETWVKMQYPAKAFEGAVFKGWQDFKDALYSIEPQRTIEIYDVVERLRKQNYPQGFKDPVEIEADRAAVIKQHGQAKQKANKAKKALKALKKKVQQKPAVIQQSLTDEGGVQIQLSSTPTVAAPMTNPDIGPSTNRPVNGTVELNSAPKFNDAAKSNGVPKLWDTPKLNGAVKVAAKLNTATMSNGAADMNAASAPVGEYPSSGDAYSSAGYSSYDSDEDSEGHMMVPDPGLIDFLLADSTRNESASGTNDAQHAPIVSEDILESNRDLLPQYGLLGTHIDTGNRIFHNTNVPFATFICGLQGSGKSHTTSSMLENALIPVSSAIPNFGLLENPLSAMVFAYDDFTGDGEGFCVSEAASLASAHPKLPKSLRVKKVTVLVSPSNPAIRKIYAKLPNVTVIPFKIDPRTLDIKTILTLMAVDESATVPLYLAQVTKILRDINVENDGRFDYATFKERLRLCNFNPAQTNMLELRLDLLESFLDQHGNAPQPKFEAGEITIMDMSCPFVDANTACILFKLGLDRYLRSKVAGKMVVLDEAHKYILDVPGAKALNEELKRVIRLQRHKGVRIVIATQEPTLLSGLIGLCDLTVIHRFSSPEWFAALKKQIPMMDQDPNKILKDIENLKPGTALVYSPKAIFARGEDGTFVKGAGSLVKVKVRQRVTADGGQSVMAT